VITVSCQQPLPAPPLGQHLCDVRFTHDTVYALLDIDAGSDYCNPDGAAEIRASLETISLTRTLLIYGTTPTRDTSQPHNNLVSFNRQQADDAQNRIRATYADLEQSGELPDQLQPG
jgi:hypothetical protein